MLSVKAAQKDIIVHKNTSPVIEFEIIKLQDNDGAYKTVDLSQGYSGELIVSTSEDLTFAPDVQFSIAATLSPNDNAVFFVQPSQAQTSNNITSMFYGFFVTTPIPERLKVSQGRFVIDL